MKKILLAVISICIAHFMQAQIMQPVKWTWKAEPVKKGIYKLIFTATIDSGWNIASSYVALKDIGPIPLSIQFDTTYVKPLDKLVEKGKRRYEFNEVFAMNLQLLQGPIVCEQTVRVLRDTKLRGLITYMAFSDRAATPPDEIPFEFNLKGPNSQGIYIQWDTTR